MRRITKPYSARTDGAVAAPTAGLHFTESLLAALQARRGVGRVTVTLHVGAGTFPADARRRYLAPHRIHAERGEIHGRRRGPPSTPRGGPAAASWPWGTTSLRLLENGDGGRRRDAGFRPARPIFFCDPGTPIRSADMLLTNFHLPRSTLFMLVCAFAGTARMKAAYAACNHGGIPFYSYGDASLLRPRA